MTERRSLLLDTCLDLITRTAMVFSLFVLFAGHNAPGGGFVGGLVAGAVLVLRYAARGDTGARTRVPGSAVLGAGITVAFVALPLAMAFGIASGVTPAQGIATSVVAGFLISLLGGSRVQIGGPADAFVALLYAIVERHGGEVPDDHAEAHARGAEGRRGGSHDTDRSRRRGRRRERASGD